MDHRPMPHEPGIAGDLIKGALAGAIATWCMLEGLAAGLARVRSRRSDMGADA